MLLGRLYLMNSIGWLPDSKTSRERAFAWPVAMESGKLTFAGVGKPLEVSAFFQDCLVHGFADDPAN